MKRRDQILDTALALFNEQGTGAVSTNHIAEAMGISPGNLYYHFGSKTEIIRALFERLFEAWDVRLNMPTDHAPTLEDGLGLVRINFQIMWEYKFIYREILALVRQDAELQARYNVVRARGYEGFQGLVAYLVETKLLNVPDERTVTHLADLIWLISEFWLTSVELTGRDVTPETMEQGVTLMTDMLRPYFIAP